MNCHILDSIKCFFTVLLASMVFCMISAAAETVQGDLEARFANEPRIECDGSVYRLRRRLTSILFAGTDSGEDSQGYALGARNGGQADFIMLIAIDEAEKKITPIQINRDTMAEITILNVMGDVSGSRVAQICLAHSFGDGEEKSCELLISAVSRFLKGTPVDHYFVMKLDALGALNDAIGGVEVTLEDDFTAYDPEMVVGKTLTLLGDQAEIFLRQRYYVGDQSNISRQKRQRAYIRSAVEKVMRKIESQSSFIDVLMDAIGESTVTDLSRGRMLNVANFAQRYEIAPIRSIDGETELGDDGFIQFHADEDALMQMLVDVFYQKVE